VRFDVLITVTVFLDYDTVQFCRCLANLRGNLLSLSYIAINMEAADAFQTSITTARFYGVINHTTTTSINTLADKLRSCLTDELFN